MGAELQSLAQVHDMADGQNDPRLKLYRTRNRIVIAPLNEPAWYTIRTHSLGAVLMARGVLGIFFPDTAVGITDARMLWRGLSPYELMLTRAIISDLKFNGNLQLQMETTRLGVARITGASVLILAQ